jgi:hypothetical protein
MCKIFILLLLEFLTLSAFGQKELSLRPSIGLQFPFNAAVSSAETFKVNNYNFGLDAGFFIQYDWNEKNSMIFGWNSTGLGYGFRFGSPSLGFARRTNITKTLNVFPLGYQKYVATAKMFRLKTPKELYAILFRFRFISGLSYYYSPPMTGDNSTYEACLGDCIIQDIVIRRSGGALFAGLNLQFFNYERDSFQFTLLYSQGLFKQSLANISYRLIGSSFSESASIISRGSYLALQISYPIKLWKQKAVESP